jgi:uncharacterized protein YcaQ
VTLAALRAHAIASTFFPLTTLRRAVERLGFVQADPIRSPARAQDLILRHRVKTYLAGDLEQQYPKLNLEEDLLYAYGFMPQATWRLLHPRLEKRLTVAEKRVLAIVSAQKRIHPRDLEAHLGSGREINAWGGYSKSTTRTLQALHYRGLIRVAGRENGIRLYEPTSTRHQAIDPAERLRQLILLIANILAPIPERSLRATLQHLRYAAPALEGRHSVATALIESGELASAEVEGLRYVWPAGKLQRKRPEESVRFLAPFDPLVWDRRRFEHFWGWAYRFEAYTPLAKRKLGYYAMPLLWRDQVIGWVNIANGERGMSVSPGYITDEPNETAYKQGFDEEVEKFRKFLRKPDSFTQTSKAS